LESHARVPLCELANGLNGGDRNQYARFFARFKREAIPLDSLRAERACTPSKLRPTARSPIAGRSAAAAFRSPAPPCVFLELKIFPLARARS